MSGRSGRVARSLILGKFLENGARQDAQVKALGCLHDLCLSQHLSFNSFQYKVDILTTLLYP